MSLAACPRCKKVFDKTRSAVCTRCQDAEDDDFDKIRAVLDHTPDLNAEQVAEEGQVTVDCVMRMIAEGFISSVSLADPIKCGRCGAPAISLSKRLCPACLEKLSAQTARTQSKIKIEPKKDVQVDEYLLVRKALEERRRT
jgi:predicted amidophosphoribosyltransferase